jgi:uncharacterized protein
MPPLVDILFVHGGMTFRSETGYLEYLATRPVSLEPKRYWIDALAKDLGAGYRVTAPAMPLKENARYGDWKIHFERHLALLEGPLVLIGNSLGGIFLAKYLSENRLPDRAIAAYLVCPPFDDSLPGEDLAGGFELPESLGLLRENARVVRLWFSSDDDVVPLAHADKYRMAFPDAEYRIFDDKNGHFKVEEFPEIAESIRSDVAKLAY